MGDLDDFFARKDKKKSKAKKFGTAGDVVKNLDHPKPEPRVVAPAFVAPAAVATPPDAELAPQPKPTAKTEDVPRINHAPVMDPDEEWKDFEEEQRKDYTGLKIGQLNLNDVENTQDGCDDDDDSDGSQANDVDRVNTEGPWNKGAPTSKAAAAGTAGAAGAGGAVVADSTPKVYISPALRHMQQSGLGRKTRTRNRAAPDLSNADFFPTLDAARPVEQRKKNKEPAFEEVRHGARIQRVAEPVAAPSPLVSNSFKSLYEDD